MKTITFGVLSLLTMIVGVPQPLSSLEKGQQKLHSSHKSSHHRHGEFKEHHLLVSLSDKDSDGKKKPAINPDTNRPYFFVFVDNAKHSSGKGTFESPYNTLGAAQANSGPNDIIYVFQGDGSAKGMNAGIQLQDSQRLWGSGHRHTLRATVGEVTVRAYTEGLPIITNTSGNAISCANDNDIAAIHVLANEHVIGIALIGTVDAHIHHNQIDLSGTTTVPPTSTGLLLNGTGGEIKYDKNVIYQTLGSSTAMSILTVAPGANLQIKHNQFIPSVGQAAQGIRFGDGMHGIAIVDFDTINIAENKFYGQGSTGTNPGGVAIGGFGFAGTGHLIIDRNSFLKQTSSPGPQTTVNVELNTNAHLDVDITNNVWSQTVNSTQNFSLIVSNGPPFAPSPPPFSICLRLHNNRSDNTNAGYLLANFPPGDIFVADIAHNVGAVVTAGTIVPGTCP